MIAPLLDEEGSTRQLGLMRIGLALLLWSCWGYPFILHFDLTPLRVGLGVGFFISSSLLFIGLWSRASAVCVAAVLVTAGVMLGDEGSGSFWRLQHRQLTTVLAVIMALAPCGRSLSLDRWLALRRAAATDQPPAAERGPLWSLRLVQLCASVVFLTTAVGQASPGWLDGSAFERGGEIPGWGPALAWMMLAVNLVAGVGPWWARGRGVAIALVSAVYLGLFALMTLNSVALIVVFMLFSFVPSDQIHRVIDRLHGRGPTDSARGGRGQ